MALQALMRNLSKRAWSCAASSSSAAAGRCTTLTPPSVTASGRKYYQQSTSTRRYYDEDQLMKNNWLSKRFMGSTAGETSDGKEVAVETTTTTDDKNRRRGKRRPPALWRGDGREFVPALQEFFPSGLGDALLQATENINRLFRNLNVSPSNLIGRFKEKDECYKLRYEVPGLSKEDLKITVDDGVLTIKGEHKEEAEGGRDDESDDEFWSARSYGFYHSSVVLPEDAKADEIKAELKDGLLHITVPRAERAKDAVKEVQIH
ncbi:26.5 kDa heat shock protein, mitochondrial [Linum grandiflorum]